MKEKYYWALPLCVGVALLLVLLFSGGDVRQAEVDDISEQKDTIVGETEIEHSDVPEDTETQAQTEEKQQFFAESKTTLEERVMVPSGYMRMEAGEGSFAEFLREYPLKAAGSPVLLYDGREKGNQSAHAAVFALPLSNEDLQQCADSVMRLYAEYFYATGQYERIAFHFVSGFNAEYVKWRAGSRIAVNGNEVTWEEREAFDDSYENFERYLRIVFTYASTLSMEAESEEIALSEIQAGDVFLQGGSPGHVVLVLDVCVNGEGKKAFLLGQGYMPAQEFHLLRNPLHEEDPWYYEEEVEYPFYTPEYTFFEGSLRRLNY